MKKKERQPVENLFESLNRLTDLMVRFYTLPILQVQQSVEALKNELELSPDIPTDQFLLKFSQISMIPLEQLKSLIEQVGDWKKDLHNLYSEIFSRRYQ